MSEFVPLYTTRGDHEAYYYEGYIFNLSGEWIGWVEAGTGDVYSVLGEYVGRMSFDGRILRRRVLETKPLRKPVPPRPPKPRLPATVRLPPMFTELDFSTIDVLDEMPERLHTIDTGELKDDMD